MSDELWRWDAARLAEAIRLGRISCREAVSASLERLAAVNGAVNAVTVVLAEEALAAADQADRDLRTGRSLGPLHGVPVTIKENVDQAGIATTNGVIAFKDLIAETDSPPAANWKNAGAIVIGRTDTPAFSLRWHTDNDLRGATLSPLGQNSHARRFERRRRSLPGARHNAARSRQRLWRFDPLPRLLLRARRDPSDHGAGAGIQCNGSG